MPTNYEKDIEEGLRLSTLCRVMENLKESILLLGKAIGVREQDEAAASCKPEGEVNEKDEDDE